MRDIIFGLLAPPLCKHNARMVGFKKKTYARARGPGCKHIACMVNGAVSIRLIQCMASFRKNHMLSSKLAQAGAGGARQDPHLQTHRSHGEWRGFKKTHINLREHYLTTTVLKAVIVIFIFMYIFIAIISMCM